LSLVSSKNKKVFLCSNTKLQINHKVDIILSPEFYWVRVFDIPVKSLTQARHVLPTLFEDILETTNELSYQVLKLKENKYLCFAYVNKKIYEAIKNSSINLSLVNSIYFAQNECKDFKQFTIEDKSFLYTNDNILVKVPNSFISEKLELNQHIENINLSSNKVDIKLYNNILTPKQIYTIIAICLFLSLINFYKVFSYKNEISTIDERIEKMKENSALPSSILQADSIINKYKAIATTEIKKREALDYILQNNKFKIKNIELDKDILNINYENADKKEIEDYISKKYKIVSSVVKNLTLNMKVKI